MGGGYTNMDVPNVVFINRGGGGGGGGGDRGSFIIKGMDNSNYFIYFSSVLYLKKKLFADMLKGGIKISNMLNWSMAKKLWEPWP